MQPTGHVSRSQLPQAATLSAAVAFRAARAAEPPARSNIVLIRSDNPGIGDVGCHGHYRFPAPHLESIAKAGVRLDQCCAAAREGR